MIERIQHFFKDQNKLAQAATVSFFIAVGFTVYFLWNLRYDLVYKGGMVDSEGARGVLAKLSIVVGLTFAFCYALIFLFQRIKKETIVYLDKKIDRAESAQSSAAGQSGDSFNLNSIREKIKSGSNEERLQNGLNELCNQLNAGQGALYIANSINENKILQLKSGFALVLAEGESNPEFNWGEGLIGQVATSGASQYLEEMPEGYAARIESGLGSALPKFLFIFPLKKENETVGVIELATFTPVSENMRKQLIEAGKILAEIC